MTGRDEALWLVGIFATSYPPDELKLMIDTVFDFRPEQIFEWGTQRGESARTFLEASLAARLGCEIHTTELGPDTFHLEHPGIECGFLIWDLPVIQHRGDGLDVSLPLATAARVLFYVDGDHAPENTTRELTGIYDACPRACVLVHDTGSHVGGPGAALAEFLAERPGHYALTHVDSPGWAGITRLWPKEKT